MTWEFLFLICFVIHCVDSARRSELGDLPESSNNIISNNTSYIFNFQQVLNLFDSFPNCKVGVIEKNT